MLYKSFGKTGLRLSVLGFGAGRLGNGYGSLATAECVRGVHCAIDAGINFFDVAPLYGLTLAESRLGQALEGKREGIILATKAGRYTKDMKTGCDYSAKRIIRSVDESLSRLRTDYIDLYQIHDVDFAGKDMIIEESLPAMLKLKEVGKIRFIGVTGYPIRMLKDVASSGSVDSVLVYCRYNLMNTTLNAVLTPFVKRNRIGLINASPLHQGILSEKGPPEWQPAPKRVKETGQKVVAYCRERGVSITDLALQFALTLESASTTLVGMGTEEEVRENVRNVGIVPDSELLSAIREIIRPAADVVWKSGRSENDDPGAVDQQM